MTDATVFQAAIVSPIRQPSDAAISQVVLIAVQKEVPPIAGGAEVRQLAIVTVSKEFVIPIIPTPISIGQFLATRPYWVGRNH